jgi:DNA-binding response OmpR family regulator
MTRILVVEDDVAVRENVIELLELEGYEVIGAANGQEGLVIAMTESCDLMICDVKMPVLDGFQVLERLRHFQKTKTLPVIFLTAKTERENQREGMDIGADDYITKPFTRLELLNSIRTRLAKTTDLDSTTLEHVRLMDQNTNLLMPMELSEPLANVLTTSEILTEAREEIPVSKIQALAESIHKSALLMSDVTQKYLFLFDLERRQYPTPGVSKSPLTTHAEIHIQEILLAKADTYGLTLHFESLKEFDCPLEEEDLYLFFDFLVLSMFQECRSDMPVRIEGKLSPDASKYRIKFDYSFDPIRMADRKLKSYYYQVDEIEWLTMRRIGTFLGITLEYEQVQSTGSISVLLPTVDLKEG